MKSTKNELLGSVVALKSLGQTPAMTVVGTRPNGDYRCVWFTGDSFKEIWAAKESLVEISG